jgi:hypothetical protein
MEGQSGVIQANGAAAALEQFFAQLSLQRLDAGGNRGLRQLEDLRRAAEGTMRRHLHECVNLAEIQGISPGRYKQRLYLA